MTHREEECPTQGWIPALDPHGADTGLRDVCPECVCEHGRHLDEDCEACTSVEIF